MLFKFKSHAASDLIMLEADARRLLKIILGEDPVQGIVLAQNLPAAIAALEAAVAQDEADRKARAAESLEDAPVESDEAGPVSVVSLAQRAAPMMKLLKRCLAEASDVVWGV